MPNAPSEDPPKPQAESSSPRPVKRKRRRLRILIVIVIILLALGLLVLLGPTIASTGMGRRIVLGQVNARLNGTVSVEDWSLGWWSDQRIEGIAVADVSGKEVMTVESVTVPCGILAFLADEVEVGEVEVARPTADVVVREDGTINLMDILPPPEPKEKKPFLGGKRVSAVLLLRDGEISAAPKGGAPVPIRDFNLAVTLDGFDAPIKISHEMLIGDERAAVVVEGEVSPFENRFIEPAAMKGNVDVALHGVNLNAVAGFAQLFGVPLEPAGSVNGQLTARMDGLEKLSADAALDLAGFSATGELLRGDTLKLETISIALNASRDGKAIRIAKVDMVSPILEGHVSGDVTLPETGGLPLGELDVEGRADVALARQLPNLLSLREDVALQSGSAVLDASMKRTAEQVTFDTTLRLADLAARKDGRVVQLERPVELVARGAIEKSAVRLDELRLDAPFASLQGQGGLNKFNLEFDLDLTAAMNQAGQFVDLGERRIAGQAKGTIEVAGPDLRTRRVRADMDLASLDVRGVLRKPLVLQQAGLSLSADVRLDERYMPEEIQGIAVKIESDAAQVEFTADAVQFASLRPLGVKNGRLSLRSSLGQLQQFAAAAIELPDSLTLGGTLELNSELALAGSELTVRSFRTALSALDVALGERRLQQPSVVVAAEPLTVQLDRSFRPRSVNDINLKAESDLAQVGFTAANVGLEPGQPIALRDGRLAMRTRLAEVMDAARAMADLPEPLVLNGELDVTTSLAMEKNEARMSSFRAAVKDLDFAWGDKHVQQTEVVITGQGTAALLDRRIALSDMEIVLAPGVLQVAEVVVPDWGRAPDGVTAQVRGGFDGAETLAMLDDFVTLPAETSLALSDIGLKLDMKQEQNRQRAALDLTLSGVAFQRGDLPEIEEKEVRLGTLAWVEAAEQRLEFETFRLDSQLASVAGSGRLEDWAGRRLLTAKGTHTLDFNRIGPLLAAMLKKPIEVAGREQKEFDVKLPLAEVTPHRIVAELLLDTGIEAETVVYRGLNVQQVAVPVRAGDGAIHVTVNGIAHQGKINLPLKLAVEGERQIASVTPDSTVLDGVVLTTELADQLIAMASPVFKDCVVSKGSIGYVSKRFRMPVGVDKATMLNELDLEGELVLNGVELTSSGFVQGVLDVVGIEPVGVKIPDQRLSLALKDGKLSHGDLKLTVQNYVLILSGTISMGGTLDMVAKVPVTRHIVERLGGTREIYNLIKDEYVSVPIKNTLSAPKYVGSLLFDNVRRLIRSAGEKLLRGGLQDQLKGIIRGGDSDDDREAPAGGEQPEAEADQEEEDKGGADEEEKDAEDAIKEEIEKEADKLIRRGIEGLFGD